MTRRGKQKRRRKRATSPPGNRDSSRETARDTPAPSQSDSLASRGAISRALFALIVGLLACTPLVFSRTTLEGFFLPKLILIRATALLALCVWIAGSYVHREARFRWSSAQLLAGLLLLSLLPSLLGSSNRLLSLDGVLALLAFLVIWFLAGSVSLDASRRRTVAVALVGVAAVEAIYATLQYLGWDPIFSFQETERLQVIGTFGNPVFLAAYLAACLPLALAALLSPLGLPARSLAALAFGVIALGIGLTGTKGAMLAAAVAVICVLALSLLVRRSVMPGWRSLVIVGVLLALAAGAALGFGSAGKGAFDVGSTLASSLDPRGVSVGQRLLLWKAALEMIRARPLLGWGPQTFRLHYLDHQGQLLAHPENASFIPLTGNPLHTHNDYLQLWVEGGALALVVFLAFVVTVFVRALKALRRSDDLFYLGMLGGLVSILVGALVSFPLHRPTTSLLFWVLAAFLTAPGARWVRLPVARPVSVVLLVVAVCALLFYSRSSVVRYRADIWNASGFTAMKAKRWREAAGFFERGLELHPRHGQSLIRLGTVYFRLGEWDKAIEALERGFREQRDAEAHVLLADAYDERDEFAKAIAEYEKAIFYKPDNVSALNNMGACYHGQGQVEAALRSWERAVKVAPQHTDTLLNLAVANLGRGDRAEAERWAQRALATEPDEEAARKARLVISRARSLR